ncbi:hypothetical protein CC78DRAFT_571074 [Lojkania enalia]|uniref:Uncharacterized protein n=1 Tax=Lojkania enalia TaxID=147567 RepID=A0A9P4K3B9_9PLEO|nr:hypothetical protein CC78DRAFT_571074 [Didymosphaeria enalia]
MPTYSWRCFSSTRASCAGGCESGVNYTSHHLRCGQLKSLNSHKSESQRKAARRVKSTSWPGRATPCNKGAELVQYSKVFTPHPLSKYFNNGSSTQSCIPSIDSNPTAPSKQPGYEAYVTKPPPCLIFPSMRSSTLALYITFIIISICSTASATPFPAYTINHVQLHNRQAIPDRTGETGNEPAPVKSQPPPRPVTPSTTPSATATGSIIISSSPSAVPPAPAPVPQPTNLNTGSTSDANPGNEIGLNPNPAPTPIRTEPSTFPLSAGAIAGIAGGAVIIVSLFVALGIWLYRRRRIDVSEIPIRRSKLGSRLGFRIFGDGPDSRAPSRRSNRESQGSHGSGKDADEKQFEAGWLDKGSISKPRTAWLENGLLSVPKPGFLRERKDVDDVAPWVDKGMISDPRPARPRSAEPLGRLSGMGLGMGYLK